MDDELTVDTIFPFLASVHQHLTDLRQERLKSHARSFDSLLSLIPANLYYSGDVSDQWKRKKQTPEEKRAAKMAKLDPDNWKSAKDIMDERAAAAALKRKREAGEDDDEAIESPGPGDGADLEQPKAIHEAQQPKPKKRKVDAKNKTEAETPEDKRRRKAEERAAKRERKKEKKAKSKEKAERQRAKKREAHGEPNAPDNGKSPAKTKKEAKELQLQTPVDLTAPLEQAEETTKQHDRPRAESPSTASSAADEEEPVEVFSPHHESGVSSTSSIQPSSIDEAIKPEEQTTILPQTGTSANHIDTSKDPRERLQEALSQFRADRKADATDGRAPKNRQELLDQRRRKEEARKAAKKEQRNREKEEEARRQDEEIARRFSPGGSGSLLASPRSPIIGDNNSSNNFTFGRIAFSDGTNFDPTTSDVVDSHKRKGPRDTASQLQLAQAKKERLAALDEEKRAQIEQKDMWLNAKRRAHGEHVRDDSSLLKKALKRQQGQKKKSEKEWTERIEGVKKAQETKQKKRTENLTKRKEEKRAGKGKKVKRPGFEGSFKGRTGGGKKRS